jgi:hypothetical protein
MGEKRNAYRLLVRKPEGKRPRRRPRRRRVDNIVEVGRFDVDWIGLAQDRDRWRALPLSAGKLSSVQTTRDLSSGAQLHGVQYSISYILVWARHIGYYIIEGDDFERVRTMRHSGYSLPRAKCCTRNQGQKNSK